MKRNIIREKSFEFALETIRIAKILNKKNEYILSNQLLKSGTAIGALVEEAIGAQSRKDFIHKMSISYIEALETKYWIRLLNESEILSVSESKNLQIQIDPIVKILASIIKSTKDPQSAPKQNNPQSSIPNS